MGTPRVINLSRCNHYAVHFDWRVISGCDILHFKGEPVMSYVLGFVKSSNLEHSTPMGSSGYHKKEVVIIPLTHEWDRLLSSCTVLMQSPIMVNVFGRGMSISTRPSGTSSECISCFDLYFDFAYSCIFCTSRRRLDLQRWQVWHHFKARPRASFSEEARRQ